MSVNVNDHTFQSLLKSVGYYEQLWTQCQIGGSCTLQDDNQDERFVHCISPSVTLIMILIFVWTISDSGIRGGGGSCPPCVKSSGQTVFRESSSCSNILKDKQYFNTVKNFRANYVFKGKRRLFQILNDKKYIFNTVNSRHTLFFRASTSCSKVLNVKTIFNTVKMFRATLFFRASANCSKFWMIKIHIQCSEFRAHSVFQGKQKLLKHPECKKYIKYNADVMTNAVFKASASSSKILKDKKYFNAVKSFWANSVFHGKRKLSKILNDKNSVTDCQGGKQGSSFPTIIMKYAKRIGDPK